MIIDKVESDIGFGLAYQLVRSTQNRPPVKVVMKILPTHTTCQVALVEELAWFRANAKDL